MKESFKTTSWFVVTASADRSLYYEQVIFEQPKVSDNENNPKTNAKILSTAIQTLPPNYALSVFIAVLVILYAIKVWSFNRRIRDVVH
jgi:hypothetical protein